MAICFILYTLLTFFFAVSLSLSLSVINARKHRKRAVGFFHPYTNDGGGGERVLWCAVKAIQEEIPDFDCFVFTGDHDSSSDSLSRRAVDRFGVHLPSPPKVIHLNKRKWIEERTYPHFTMIGQSLGSVYLAWEALRKFTPLYFLDTSGYAFTYPLARIFGCKVVCYTHYPTISLDMISRVRQRNSMYNNDASIATRFGFSFAWFGVSKSQKFAKRKTSTCCFFVAIGYLHANYSITKLLARCMGWLARVLI